MTVTSAAFTFLQIVVGRQGPEDEQRKMVFAKMNRKAGYSVSLYAASVALAFVSVNVAFAIFVLIPLLYFWPEYRAATKE